MPDNYMEHFSDLELVNELVRRGVRLEVYPNLTIYGPTRVEYRDQPRNASPAWKSANPDFKER